jgi:hypothetical protein
MAKQRHTIRKHLCALNNRVACFQLAKMCRLRKTVALPVCARRLSVTVKATGTRVVCRVLRLCFYENGICERWGRRVLSIRKNVELEFCR